MHVEQMSSSPMKYDMQNDTAALLSRESSSLKASVTTVEKNAEMTLYTEEGDKVTISLNDSRETGYAGYTRYGRMSGPGFQSTSFSRTQVYTSESEREISFSVEGDLNKQERKDIRKAVKAMRRMMRDFMSGNTSKMERRAGNIKELDSIAGLEVSMDYEKNTVELEQRQQTTEATIAAFVPEKDDSSEPSDLSEKVNDLTDRMISEIKDRRMNRPRLHDAMEQMFSAFRNNEESGKETTGDGNQIVSEIRSNFFNKFENMAEMLAG